MQRQRLKWRADKGARALKTVGEVKASIEALDAEDLLDLHDIFRDARNSAMGAMAAAEVQKRGLKV